MKHTRLALTITLVLASQTVSANPTGAQVVHGSASFSSPNANVLNVTNSHNAIIQWQNFNIGRGQTTNFIQPSSASAVLNRVTSNSPSSILGNLNSNGKVFLINQHGLLVGEGANINTAGFFGSTLNITDADFLNGKLKFYGGGLGDIHNQGYIHAGGDGNIVLIAPNIENGGVIEVDNGNIILAAGQSITITSLQNSAIEYEVSSPENSITNLGQIIARQGAASMFAGSLKHSGSIRANGLVQDADGTIRLVATDHNEVSGQLDVSGKEGGRIEILGDVVEVQDGALVNASGTNGGGEILIGGDQQGLNAEMQNAASTTIAAGAEVQADATNSGNGGKVIVFAENDVHVHGSVTARGGVNGGDGGFIETSGLSSLDITNIPEASSATGNAGSWMIDPFDITIQAAGPDTNITVINLGGSTIRTSNTDSAILTTGTIVGALTGGTSVIVQTGAGGTQQGNITINDPINASPSVSLVSLTFNAHNDINVNADITNGGFGYDLIMNPDSDTTGGGQVNFGNTTINVGGAINLNGPAFINGVTDFNGGNVILADVLTVNPGGQFLKGFGQFGGSGSIINDGTALFSGGCGDGCTPIDMDVPFTNNSILRLDQVFFNVNNTMTNNGLIDLVFNPFLDGSGLKIGDGLLAGNLILDPGTTITGGLGTDITIGPLGSMDVLTPTVIDPAINLILASGTINNFQNLTIPDQVFINGGTLSGPGTFTVSLLSDAVITIAGNNPLTINDLVMELGGADVLWQANGPGGGITLNNSSLIIEDRFEISNTDPGAAISGTNSDIVLGADSFLTQFSSVNTNINVPISSARGYIQLFGLGGGLTLPGDLTIQDGGHLAGVGTLNLGSAVPGTLVLASGGGVEPGLDFGIGTGTLFVNGNVLFEANSRGVFELNNAATDGWDQLSVSGAVTIDPGSNLYVLWDDFATQTIQVGTPLDLIFTQATLSGNFTNRIDPVSVTDATVTPLANSLQYTVNAENFASVFFWDGGGDGVSWSDRFNWNSGLIQDELPGTDSLVVLEAGTFDNPILLTTLEPDVGGLGATQIDGGFEIGAGGNLNIGGNLVTRADMILLDGATISGGGTWHILGFTDLAGVNTTLTVANIDNHAALVWAQFGVTDSILNVNGNVTNYGSQLMFSFQTNSNTLNYAGPAGLVNHGFFAIDSGSDLLLNGTFSNLASAEFFMRGANVLVGGDTSMDGQLLVSPGSQLVFQGGSHSFAGTLAQAGQMVFDAGTFTGVLNLPGDLDIRAALADVTFDALLLDTTGNVQFSSAGNDLVFNNASAWVISGGALSLIHTADTADFTGTGGIDNFGGTIDMLSANDFNLALALDSGSAINIDDGNFIVQGVTNLVSGGITINNGATFTVGAGGAVFLGSTFNGIQGNGTGRVVVDTGGQFDFGLGPKNLSSLQSLDITGGILVNAEGVTLPAILNMSNNGFIQGAGALTIPTTTQVNWNGGFWAGEGVASLLNVENQGDINVLAGQAMTLSFADLSVSGTGSLTGAGQVLIPVNSSLSAAGSIDVSQISLTGGTLNANGLVYSGLLDWQSGTVIGSGLTTSAPVSVTNGILFSDWVMTATSGALVSGSIDLQGGTVNIASGADFTIGSGAQALVASTFGGFSGGGQLDINVGGLLDLNANLLNLSGLQTFNINGATVENIQGLSMPVTMNVSGNSLLRGNGTLLIPAASTVFWNGGTFSGLDTVSRLTVNNQGSINVLAGQTLGLNFADLSISATASLTGAGEIQVLTDNQLIASAGVDIARIGLSGGTLVSNGMTYSGNLNWLSGTVTGTGLITTGPVNLTAGILQADWTISPTGSVFWNGSSTDALVINNATITNQGTFNITSFVDLTLPRPATSNQAAKDFSASIGAGFINQGLLVIDSAPGVAGGADTVVFDLNFVNDGGSIGIASGTFSLGGQDLLLDQAGESLQGFGTFEGNVINSAGLVSPGRSDPANNVFQTGDLTILGDFTQTANGTLGIDLDSTVSGLLHDTLNVTGQFNAGGDIVFNIINNKTVLEIALLLDQSFRPLNFTTFAGRFASIGIPAGLNFELSDNGLITITSNNTDLIQISNQLEVLFNNDDLSYSTMVKAMKFVDKKVNFALLGEQDDEEERKRAPRLVCK